ncbi:MAG TPA: YggT family protein [Candidatus Melainabacteria bacterium]|nr:YggT family protein [Candidatus Melainabacteria bacterium]
MGQPGAILSTVIEGYTFVIILWCLLSWFPNIRWYDQPFKTLNMLVDPVLSPFRKLIPPLGGIDISPMVAILILQFIAKQVGNF